MSKMGADITILSSATVVLGGLVALVRALLKIRDDLRDNTRATGTLTTRMNEFAPLVNGRFERLEKVMLRMWVKLFPGEPPPDP